MEYSDIEFFRYCSDCPEQGERSCYDCENCGWCIDDNLDGTCKQGDEYGPYFSDNCRQWFYEGNKRNSRPIYIKESPIVPIFDRKKIIIENNLDNKRKHHKKENYKLIIIFLMIIIAGILIGLLLN